MGYDLKLSNFSMHGGYRIADEFAEKVKESDLETQKKMFLTSYRNHTSFITDDEKREGKIFGYFDDLLVYPGDRDKEKHKSMNKTMYLGEIIRTQMSPEDFDKFLLDSFTSGFGISGGSYSNTFSCIDDFAVLGLLNTDESKLNAYNKMFRFVNGENGLKKKLSTFVGGGFSDFLFQLLPTFESRSVQESCVRELVNTMPSQFEIALRTLVNTSLAPIDPNVGVPPELIVNAGEALTPEKVNAILKGAKISYEHMKNVSWDYEKEDINAPRVDFEAEKAHFKNRGSQVRASSDLNNPFSLDQQAELARRQIAVAVAAQSQTVGENSDDYGSASGGGYSK